ncbi:hypothetical protein [Streptosporangium roseum]|uniref:hypothetical protein n=1 Tax=Streptosporangium roseum TaxID=2001 RepID=UPI00332F8176
MGVVRAFALTVAAVATAVIVAPSPAFAGDGTITSPTQASTAKTGQSVTVTANTDGTCDPVLRVRTPDGALVKVAVGDSGTMCGPITFGGTYVPDAPGTHTVVLSDAKGLPLTEVAITVETPPAATPTPTPTPTESASSTPTPTASPSGSPTVVATVVATPPAKPKPTPTPTGKAKATPTPTVTRTITLPPAAPTYPAAAPVQQLPQVVVNQPPAETPQDLEAVFTPPTPAAEAPLTMPIAPVAYQAIPGGQPDTLLVVLATLGGVAIVALLGVSVWAVRHRDARPHREPGQRRNRLN